MADEHTVMKAEEQQLVGDAEKVASMIQTDAWNIVKAKLDARILDLQNISNIDTSDVSTIATQIAARRMATDLLYGWLKDDVYGAVEQQRANAAPRPQRDDEIVDRNG